MRGTGKAVRLGGLTVALLLCLVVATAAAKPPRAAAPNAQASIVGGAPTTIAEFPSLAYIQAKEGPKDGFACTGTVIAPRVILTAGHCIEDIETGHLTPPHDYRVATGIANLDEVKPEQIFKVTQALTYPEFDPGATRGDAGILVLNRATTAPPIALPTAADAPLLAAGTPVQIAGWGLEGANDSSPPATLRTASTLVQTNGYCRGNASRYYPFYSAALQLCTTDTPALDSGGCFGDSGGPAIAHRADGTAVEIGVISTGAPGCKPTLPNIFTRADLVSTWVAEWVAAIEAGAPAPAIRVPSAKLPVLTIPKAKTLVGQTLANAFGSRFTHSFGIRVRCERVGRLRVRCGLAWFYGRNDYYGTVSVNYAYLRSSVIWKGSYAIHWVNDRCWFESGHRASCTVHTRHG
ncbi:MAG: serine protease [Solirubrobacterales bacterium]